MRCGKFLGVVVFISCALLEHTHNFNVYFLVSILFNVILTGWAGALLGWGKEMRRRSRSRSREGEEKRKRKKGKRKRKTKRKRKRKRKKKKKKKRARSLGWLWA